jgi:hypothetical protein
VRQGAQALRKVPSVRRRLAVFLLVCLAVPAVALAADTDPKRQINAVDQRKAASIVLKRSDFAAGWKKEPSTPETDEDNSCPGYNPDQSDLVLTGEVEADFEAGEGIPAVSSVANVYKTKRDAVAAWTRSAKPALASCLAQVLKREVEKTGGKVTIAKSGAIAFPKLAPRTVAYRVGFTVTITEAGKTTAIPFTLHVIVLGNGRGDCGLITFGIGSGLAMADLRAFAKLTAARLGAAKL